MPITYRAKQGMSIYVNDRKIDIPENSTITLYGANALVQLQFPEVETPERIIASAAITEIEFWNGKRPLKVRTI